MWKNDNERIKVWRKIFADIKIYLGIFIIHSLFYCLFCYLYFIIYFFWI